jgi:hypothetical protein
MCQKEKTDNGWLLSSLVELTRFRLEHNGRYPRYLTAVQREAYKRYAQDPIAQRVKP